MSLSEVPARIGPYRVERELGRGGMGVVYLAHDTRLDRMVALKSLPAEVASDPERLVRFEREAKLLAALNHPNIGAIYDVVESDGRRYLALEHVEGQALAQRLARGGLPVSEATEIGWQIATGMEAAHERGVIHRDLKPGNVMITPADQVKIVDFGLAKGTVASDSASQESPTVSESSPTLTSPAFSPGSVPGVILGTAPYLSPEQARGKPVDRRTDIWSFGCILYECLTGKLAFRGDTVSDTVAKILEGDPDWALLPRHTPARMRDLLRRCLEKDARKRLRDMGDVRIVLEEIRQGVPSASDEAVSSPRRSGSGPLRTVIVAGLGVAIGAIAAFSVLVPLTRQMGLSGGANGPVHLNLAVPDSLIPVRALLTPDGRAVIMLAGTRSTASAEAPNQRIYLRRFDQRTFEPIRGTDRGIDFRLSTSGRTIYLVVPVSEHSEKKVIARVPVEGGPAVRFCDFDNTWAGWIVLDSGEVIASLDQNRGHVRIASGGSTRPVSMTIPGLAGSCYVVSGLPGDRSVLLGTISYDGSAYHRGIGVADLRTGKARVLFTDGGSPHYLSTGHLFFTRWGVLMAASFDLRKLTVTGEPVAVLGGLRRGPIFSHANIDVASTGTLLSVSGGSFGDRRPAIIDREGHVADWSPERQPFDSWLAASPDGERFASVITNADGLDEIWVSQRGAATSRKIVAIAGSDCSLPVWSPDGRRLAFVRQARSKDDGIYVTASDGSGAPHAACLNDVAKRELFPQSWLPDGSRLLCTARGPGTHALVTIAPGPGGARVEEPKVILGGRAQYFDGAFSPDGRWIAYGSDEFGKREVFVREYHSDGRVGDPIQVSVGGGTGEVWRHDGREIAYGNGAVLMSVQIRAGASLVASAPQKLWNLDSLGVVEGRMADLLPDGRMVAVMKGPSEGGFADFDVSIDFFDEIRRRLKDKSR